MVYNSYLLHVDKKKKIKQLILVCKSRFLWIIRLRNRGPGTVSGHRGLKDVTG